MLHEVTFSSLLPHWSLLGTRLRRGCKASGLTNHLGLACPIGSTLENHLTISQSCSLPHANAALRSHCHTVPLLALEMSQVLPEVSMEWVSRIYNLLYIVCVLMERLTDGLYS